MFIPTRYTSDTYKAEIRSDKARKFKILYTTTCTSGEKAAASQVVAKYFGMEAAKSIRPMSADDRAKHDIADFCADPNRKTVFEFWTFNQR